MNSLYWKGRLSAYWRLMRLDKPIGTLLLLWPTLWGVWVASGGRPSLSIVVIFVVGTLLTRSGGCVLNDLADRKFDHAVRRTAQRPLVTGEVSVTEAAVLAICCFALSFLLIIGFSRLTLLLAVLALFLAGSYPLTKRFFAIPQAYLGLAFSFGIPMAFAAVQNALPPVTWLLFFAGCLWSIAYDTEYAMVDREDDLRIGIRTSAITFGRFDVAAIMACYAGMLGLLGGAGLILNFNCFYYVGLAAAGGFMLHHYFLIRRRDPDDCFKAFLRNNWVGAVIFMGIALSYVTATD